MVLFLCVYSTKPYLVYYCLCCQSSYLSYVRGYTPPIRFLLLVLSLLSCHWFYYVLRPCPATKTKLLNLKQPQLECQIVACCLTGRAAEKEKQSDIMEWTQMTEQKMGPCCMMMLAFGDVVGVLFPCNHPLHTHTPTPFSRVTLQTTTKCFT